jgi:glycosyltransferase involved in cell wall biosynthesis
MNLLTVAFSLLFGGAQVSTLEFLDLLRSRVRLKVLTCDGADPKFLDALGAMGIETYRVPCRTVLGYPMLSIEQAQKLVEWADVVWISDEADAVVPQIKKIRKVPVVAHIRSYAFICPWWGALYGFREPCLEKCSAWRITRCKQGINLELAKIGLLGNTRARLYWLLDFVKGPLDFFRWSELMNGVVESIDGFIAVSKAVWDIHVRHLSGLSSKPFSIVYNPVTAPLRYVKQGTHEPYDDYILYASGSGLHKGPHLLLKSWATVSKEFRDLKLYMIGCKGSWVESLAKKMSLNNVVFFSKLPSEELYRLMYKARAVVMPSIWPEPFGRIPVEANRLGVPAVVSSAGGLPEAIVNGVTGYVFKAGDADDLAEKVVKVLERDFNREEVIRHSYEKINPHREVERLVKFFESLVNYERRV